MICCYLHCSIKRYKEEGKEHIFTVKQLLESAGLSQLNNQFIEQCIESEMLFDLKPEEFSNMLTSIGIKAWGHRHNLSRAVDEAKSKTDLKISNTAITNVSKKNSDQEETNLAEKKNQSLLRNL